MLPLLPLVPALPFLGFLVLALFGRRMSRAVVNLIGVGSVGLAALVTIVIGLAFLASPPANGAYVETLWTWITAGSLQVGFTLYLDSLSLTMAFVVTFVGFLIHLYSVEYMGDDPDVARFFAYMNLFVGMMLTLVLASSLLLLMLGWEGVGLCSYLLIGFWYRDPAERSGGAQGLRRHPSRRHRLPDRPLLHLHSASARSTSRPRWRRSPSSGRSARRWRSRRRCSYSAARSASRPSYHSRCGSPTRWPARRRSRRSSTRRRWLPRAST